MAPAAANRDISELNVWSTALRTIATQPLALCPEFPAIARRFEAWWNHAPTDRPIFIGAANARPERSLTRRLNLLAHPDAWFAAKRADLDQTHRVGDALPQIRVDFGPVLLGGMLGGITEFGSDTAWTHPFIDDAWSNAPDWKIPSEHPLWKLLRELTERVACDAAGKYLLCTPDLGGSADVLLNLRSSAPLCLDLVDHPSKITETVEAIYPAWRQAFCELYRITLPHHTGLIHWIQLWSERPYLVPACDFMYLIGKPEFERFFLPDIVRQTAAVGRAAFHLDGPEATRHIDALLEVPDIQAIQFTPGEGAPSALAWVEMFRKIQAKGRSLLIVCPPAEVLALCERLQPEGLAIWVGGGLSVAELDALFDRFQRRYQ